MKSAKDGVAYFSKYFFFVRLHKVLEILAKSMNYSATIQNEVEYTENCYHYIFYSKRNSGKFLKFEQKLGMLPEYMHYIDWLCMFII